MSFPVFLILSQISWKRPGTGAAVVDVSIRARRAKKNRRNCILKEARLTMAGKIFEMGLMSVVSVSVWLRIGKGSHASERGG